MIQYFGLNYNKFKRKKSTSSKKMIFTIEVRARFHFLWMKDKL